MGLKRVKKTPVALSKYEEHLMSIVPGYKPSTAAQLREFLFSMGITEDTLDAHLQAYDRIALDKIDRAGILVIGVKPKPGDPDVYSVQIPDSPYVIRMWDGGMGPYGHFCLDFYDTERKAPRQPPSGAHPMAMPPPGFGQAPQPGDYIPPSLRHKIQANASSSRMCRGLGSLERNLRIKSISEGEEKWSIPEGHDVMPRRDGLPDFTFQMPAGQPRVVTAQPQLGVL